MSLQTPHLFSVYQSEAVVSSPDPGRTLSSRFEHKHLVCSIPRVCDHMVQVLFIFFAAVLKALVYILLICMPTRRFHFIKSYLINYIFNKKKKTYKNQTTSLTFTFRHPMSLDCRIQLLLSQSSSFLVVDRNSPAESCFNSKHTQVFGFAYSQVCWRTEPNSTGKWL